MRTRLLIAAALASLMGAPVVYALGFGEIQVDSALNAPLQAEIPLLAIKPAERDQVSVDIASPKTFKRFGIPRPGALDNINVKLLPGASETRLRAVLTSSKPIREPFLTFLLQADWPEGRAIREYTVLLDPPVQAPATQASPQPQPAPQAQPRENSNASPAAARAPDQAHSRPKPKPEVQTQPRTKQQVQPSRPAPVATAPAPEPQPAAEASSAQTYGPIAPEETLWSIAKKLRPQSSITMDQMLLALYQSNPQAFDGNMNRMLKGTVLIVPTAAEIRTINPESAHRKVIAQKRAYQHSRQPAASLAQKKPAAKAESASTTKPEKGKLRLEPAGETNAVASNGKDNTTTAQSTSQAKPGDTLNALAATAEVTHKQEQGSAETARHNKPEQQAQKQSGAASNNSQQPQANQSTSQAKATASAGADTGHAGTNTDTRAATSAGKQQPQPGEAAQAPAAGNQAQASGKQSVAANAGETGAAQAGQQQPADGKETAGDEQESAVAGQGAAASAESDKQQQAGDNAAADSAAASAAAGKSAENTSASTAPAKPGAKASSPKPAVPKPAQPAGQPIGAEQSVASGDWGSLLTSRNVLIALAVLLLLVALPMWFRSRRYQPMDADAIGGGAPALDPDTQVDSPAAGPRPPAGDAPGVEEVLEDADSHLAFDLHDEALAAVNVGLEHHPGSAALHRKALEIHHAAGDKAAFLRAVEAYYPAPDADDPDWRAVAAMGRDMAPEEPRFANVPPPAASVQQGDPTPESEPEAQSEPEPDLDIAAAASTSAAALDVADGADTGLATAAQAGQEEPADEGSLAAFAAESTPEEEPAEDEGIDLSGFDADFDDFASGESDQSESHAAATSAGTQTSDALQPENDTETPRTGSDAELEADLAAFDMDADLTDPGESPGEQQMSTEDARTEAPAHDFDLSELELESLDAPTRLDLNEPAGGDSYHAGEQDDAGADTDAPQAADLSLDDDEWWSSPSGDDAQAGAPPPQASAADDVERPADAGDDLTGDLSLAEDDAEDEAAGDDAHDSATQPPDSPADRLDAQFPEPMESGPAEVDIPYAAESTDDLSVDMDIPAAASPQASADSVQDTGAADTGDIDDLQSELDRLLGEDTVADSVADAASEPAAEDDQAGQTQQDVQKELDRLLDDDNFTPSPAAPATAPEAPDDLLLDDSTGVQDVPEADPEADDEVTTKLDLARAYLDMGEPDMAASLLQEVKEQGSPRQQQEADSLLSRSF